LSLAACNLARVSDQGNCRNRKTCYTSVYDGAW
jgi:hypothetical protein